ncbi:MAG: hypothetical protein ACRDWY_04090 [Actinomycetes bacterium]
MATERVNIDLTNDEALVLLEWLNRFNRREDVEFDDQAEQRVLWDVEASLEAALTEPFSSDYDRLLADARDRVRDPVE